MPGHPRALVARLIAPFITLASFAVFNLVGIPRAHAQSCEPQWLPGQSVPWIDDAPIHALRYLPNGDLLVGGDFFQAGGLPIRGLARWNGAVWSSFDTDALKPAEGVTAIVVGPTGDIFVAGGFRDSTGLIPTGVARWDGVAWHPMGTGASPTFLAIAPTNELVGSGSFLDETGTSVDGVARWDGENWVILAPETQGLGGPIAVAPNGDIFTTQSLKLTSGVIERHVLRWNGSSWTPLGGNFDNSIWALAVHNNGDVIAAGAFKNVDSAPAYRVVRWNGSAWQSLGACPASPLSLAFLPDGKIAVGAFQAGLFRGVYVLDGTSWSSLQTGPFDLPSSIAELITIAVGPNGEIAAGCSTLSGYGTHGNHVAEWRDGRWSTLGAGFNNGAALLSRLPDGRVLTTTASTLVGGQNAQGSLAIWDETGWSSFLTPTPPKGVTAIRALRNGDIAVAGFFADTAPTNLKIWNGSTWISTATKGFTGTGQVISAITEATNGDLIVGGSFFFADGTEAHHVARWNGAAWSNLGYGPLGTGSIGSPGIVRAIATTPNGHVLIGGVFTKIADDRFDGRTANRIARWDGSHWSTFGSGVTGVAAAINNIVVLPNSDIIAAGSFTAAGGSPALNIARWDGSTWSPLGPGLDRPVVSLVLLPSGELRATGSFQPPGQTARFTFAYWNGSSWRFEAPAALDSSGAISASIDLPNGDIGIVGGFTSINGLPQGSWARWSTNPTPFLASQPLDALVLLGDTVTFDATPADGYINLHAQWQLESTPGSGTFIDLAPGPIPGSAANAEITQPAQHSDPGPTTLRITNADATLHARRVRAILSNACGSATSDPALLTIAPPCPCPADFDASGGTPNDADIQAFFDAWLIGQSTADADCSGGTPDLSDIDTFITAWLAGGC